MSLRIAPEAVEPMVAGLLGGIDVSGGPTDEQLAVLGALAAHLWERPDLDVAGVAPAGPDETAARLADPVLRRRFHELHMTLESCRHPQTTAQVARVEAYAEALGTPGPDLALFRRFVDDGRERAMADVDRFLQEMLADRIEAPLAGLPIDPDHAEPELAARVLAFAELDEGSLGRAFLDHYERNGLPIPGVEASPMNHFFVGHDMTHVIAGLTTTALAEVALSAFQMAVDDNDRNVSALLASLVCHEAGFGSPGTFAPEDSTLAAPGAAELLGRELARGSACTADFSLVDHFALAPLPLAEVRRRFGVQPPTDPDDGHHHW
jgi:hypothetical protein